MPIVETLPAGLTDITVSAYAKFAAFTQDPGAYSAGNPGILQLQYFSPEFTTAFPANGANGIFAINDWPSGVASLAQFGFFDDTSGGGIKYTELSANNGGALGQSNGLIFKISDTHYIVAFEDGGGVNSLGDRDYNDLVFNVNHRGRARPPQRLPDGLRSAGPDRLAAEEGLTSEAALQPSRRSRLGQEK